MNDSLTSASMRRETMRSRLFGAVMRRGFLGGNSALGQQQKYTLARRRQQPAMHRIIRSVATTYASPSALRRLVILALFIRLVGRERFACGALRILPGDRFPLGAQPLVPLTRDLARELAVAEPER